MTPPAPNPSASNPPVPVPAEPSKIFPSTSVSELRPLPFLPVLVSDVMTGQPVSVEPTATIKEMAHLLLDRDIRAVPVVDIGGVVVGVVAEADLISRAGYPVVRSRQLSGLIQDALVEHHRHWLERSGGLTAGEIMTCDVVSCRSDEPVAIAGRRMLRCDVRTLPVIDEGRLVGMLSRHDLLHLYDRPDREVHARIRELLADPSWAPEGHHVQHSVHDGVVLLTGTVLHPSDQDVVTAIVRQVPGVLEVANRTTATEAEPRPAFLHDADWR
jgi:CBS domain-containing protein